MLQRRPCWTALALHVHGPLLCHLQAAETRIDFNSVGRLSNEAASWLHRQTHVKMEDSPVGPIQAESIGIVRASSTSWSARPQ